MKPTTKPTPLARAPSRAQRHRRPTAIASVALAAALAFPLVAQAAGEVEVNWNAPEQFRDIGLGSFERERNLRTLEQHFNRLGRHLAEGQTLHIEVDDVDLAGEMWPAGSRDFRIARGGVDFPQIDLRWKLRSGEQVLARGEDRVADMNYLFGRRMASNYGPLPYERRMLEDWFRQRVAGEGVAGR